MTRCLITLMVLALVSFASGQGVVESTPKIECKEPVWDFGTEPQHQELRKTLTVTNVGTAPLKITQVTKSCNCAGAVVGKSSLEPGESGEIEFRFETRNFSGPTTKVLQVVSNDPVNPRLRITITGRVIPPFWLLEKELTFGDVVKGKPSESRDAVLVVSSAVAKTLKIRSTDPSSTRVEVVPGKVEDREDGSKAMHFSVRITDGYPVGMVQETVSIVTDAAQDNIAVLRLNGTVVGQVALSPKSFNLGHVTVGETPSRELILTKRGAADLKIESLKVTPADVFEAKVEALEDGRRFKITVSLKADVSPKYHRGQLLVKTNAVGEELHKAYFYTVVKGATP